jgi:hypothetical protein
MGDSAKRSLRRDVVRMAWQAGLILGLLGSLYVGMRFHRTFQAFYYAGRMAHASWVLAPDWAEKLGGLGPQAAPACRWAYRHCADENARFRAAEALGQCAGLEVLLRLVGQEGPGTPAEGALVCRLCDPNLTIRADAGLRVEELDTTPPKKPWQPGPNQKIALLGSIGNYEVVVEYGWWNAERGGWSKDGKVTTDSDLYLDATVVTVYRRQQDRPGAERVGQVRWNVR